MPDAKGNVHKDRYEYYDKERWMWSTPAFVLATHHPQASEMFDVSPCKAQFDDRGIMTSVEIGAKNSNIQVVKNVNGDRLNQFVVSRINQ